MNKDYIKGLIENILSSQFSNKDKKIIREYHDRLNFACPYCGDSATNNRAKRGNIWYNKLLFICFNCNIHKSLDKMCKDFDIRISADMKIEIRSYLDKIITYKDYDNNLLDTKLDNLISIEELSEYFNSGKSNITDFKPIVKNSGVYKNLVARNIDETKHKNIYQAKYWVSDSNFEYIMCFLNMNNRNNKVIGMQIRNLKTGKNRRFQIYNFETLYKWVHNIENSDDIEFDTQKIILYNKMGYYFNIMNVDFLMPITIFEGYLDSLFYPNSIGVVGTGTDMSFLESNDIDIRYFYDNDKAGFIKTYEKIRLGYSVFLWKKLFSDIIKNAKIYDPYKMEFKLDKIKDLNKLAEIFNNPYFNLNLESYFSIDKFDIKYIPKNNLKYVNFTDGI